MAKCLAFSLVTLRSYKFGIGSIFPFSSIYWSELMRASLNWKLSSLSIRAKAMDIVFPIEAGKQLPRSLEKYELNNLTRNSFRAKCLAFIGAHEFHSPEVSLVYSCA